MTIIDFLRLVQPLSGVVAHLNEIVINEELLL